MSTAAFFSAETQKMLWTDENCKKLDMEVVMTKHETREYAFLLLYEAMVRAEEMSTIEELYASTEEMLELPIPEKVKLSAEHIFLKSGYSRPCGQHTRVSDTHFGACLRHSQR